MTFFSGTDIATLKEEGADRNHFVSLIVNNEGTYTAAITRKISYIESRKISYNTFDNIEIKDVEEIFEKQTELEYFNLDIIFEGVISNFQEMADRLSEIKKAKESKVILPTVSLETTNGKTIKANPETKQLTLFNDIKNSDMNINNHIDQDVIDSYVKQLLTGSILVNKDSKLDLANWCAKNMEKLFERRFGKGDEGDKMFNDWATGTIEFILWSYPEDYSSTNDPTMGEIAYELILKLSECPTNKYIESYKEILSSYVE